MGSEFKSGEIHAWFICSRSVNVSEELPEWLLATNSNTNPFFDAGTIAREFNAPPLCRVVSMAADRISLSQ
jgi:hypothetical protein